MSLLVQDYWKDPVTKEDRRTKYAHAFTTEIDKTAQQLVARIQMFIADYADSTGDHDTLFTWASGWRPPEVNAATPNAAKRSKHMTGHAGDVAEPAHRPLTKWAVSEAGKAALLKRGLWMEHPSATRGETGQHPWCHLQGVPPRSGNLIFYP